MNKTDLVNYVAEQAGLSKADATRALDAQLYAIQSDGKHRVTFDKVVAVMKQTGHDLPSLYKETSMGGLATSLDISQKG